MTDRNEGAADDAITQSSVINAAAAKGLGGIDDLISLNRKASQTLEALLFTIFDSWFVNFDPVISRESAREGGVSPRVLALFPPRLSAPVMGPREIPEGWSLVSLDALVALSPGRPLPSDARRPGPVPVIGGRGFEGCHDTSLVAGPGVVVSRRVAPGTVTWVAGDFFPLDSVFVASPRSPSLGLPFLYCALRRQRLSCLAAGSVLPSLAARAVYDQAQVLPSQDLLDEFNDFATPLLDKISSLARTTATLEETRAALLPRILRPVSSVKR